LTPVKFNLLTAMLTDTHCHLDFPEFDEDRDEAIKRARTCGIKHIINIGSSLKSSANSVELSQKYDFIHAAVGIHPHEADTFNKEAEAAIRELARRDKVVAIGEIGLDYFKNYSSPENQRLMFGSLIGLAKELGLPLVLHSRQAPDDTLKALKSAMPLCAVVHCFSGDESFLKECLDLGFYISFTCNITYKKAEGLRRLVKSMPLERLLLETDAPYLSPEGLRGRRNEPANVRRLADEVSAIKGLDVAEVARVTTANAEAFFKLK